MGRSAITAEMQTRSSAKAAAAPTVPAVLAAIEPARGRSNAHKHAPSARAATEAAMLPTAEECRCEAVKQIVQQVLQQFGGGQGQQQQQEEEWLLQRARYV
ncbi:hypothetical protein ACH5RR_027911 [Cinchona calisaya]|uniref:Uncharacterized protein n=1 Tax=Cinchona calisaya TaxID=153742 RepID=A0ABD2YR95_9GENT